MNKEYQWKSVWFTHPLSLLDQFSEMIDEERLDQRVPYGDWRTLKKDFTIDPDTQAIGFCLGPTDQDPYEIRIEDRMCNGEKTLLYIDQSSPFGVFMGLILQGIITPWKESNPSFTIDDKTHKISFFGDYTTYITPSGKTCTIKTSNDTERESNNMKFNFDFGSCENDNVRMSPYGIAIKNTENSWVSYDSKSGNIIDVDIFNFDGGKYLFKLPVAVKDIKVGDTIIHQRVPVYVIEVKGNDVTVVDPRAGDKKTILPVNSPFGFSFITKVVSLLDGAFGATPSNDNPFGNMLPFFLLSNSDGKNKDIDPLMMAMLLGNNAAGGFQNPMMLALLCGNQTNMRDVLPLMMLANQNTATPLAGFGSMAPAAQ